MKTTDKQRYTFNNVSLGIYLWFFIEEEFRSQNSGVRINQSGIQTAQELFALASRREDHQIFNLVGVQKRRLFRRSSTR